jgi:hypothetical protein
MDKHLLIFAAFILIAYGMGIYRGYQLGRMKK